MTHTPVRSPPCCRGSAGDCDNAVKVPFIYPRSSASRRNRGDSVVSWNRGTSGSGNKTSETSGVQLSRRGVAE